MNYSFDGQWLLFLEKKNVGFNFSFPLGLPFWRFCGVFCSVFCSGKNYVFLEQEGAIECYLLVGEQ